MRKEINALELRIILRELEFLIGSRVDKCYSPERSHFLLQFHVPSIGKKILRILFPSLFYLTEKKGTMPARPTGFVLVLRKYLEGAKLISLNQIRNERIVQFKFKRKDILYSLYVELFGNGNLIICDENNKILSLLEAREWKDRKLARGELYMLPPEREDIFSVSENRFYELLTTSTKQSLVAALATLGLGGMYAEELCNKTGLDSKQAPQITKKEAKKLFTTLHLLMKQAIQPVIVVQNGKPIEALPFPFTTYADEQQSTKTFSQALDAVLTPSLAPKTISKHQIAIDKLKKAITIQTKNITRLEQLANENQQKGELIYERYQEINTLLNALSEARKKYSWEQIQEKVKKHALIKEIIPKTGEVVIELK